jgi:hypothetical protein
MQLGRGGKHLIEAANVAVEHRVEVPVDGRDE